MTKDEYKYLTTGPLYRTIVEAYNDLAKMEEAEKRQARVKKPKKEGKKVKNG